MVISLEPNPFSYQVLKVNSLLNPGLNIHTHNVAAGDGNVTDLQFTYGGDMCNGGIVGDWKDAKQETALHVQVSTGSDGEDEDEGVRPTAPGNRVQHGEMCVATAWLGAAHVLATERPQLCCARTGVHRKNALTQAHPQDLRLPGRG
jgi:hypothetical protein